MKVMSERCSVERYTASDLSGDLLATMHLRKWARLLSCPTQIPGNIVGIIVDKKAKTRLCLNCVVGEFENKGSQGLGKV